ncbi:MAG: RnfABCDGE type electron transport complex subunit D [Candidatus Izimaplasma sp.]|nr:RnfABCDGE type electron transport complex subunit D [Candidatus Izimaplasma bacterium]
MKQLFGPFERQKFTFLIGTLVMLIAGATIFGNYVYYMALVAIIVSGIVDLIFAKIRGYQVTLTILITPLILTLLLPPTLPLYMVGVGAFFAAFFAKGVFGGADKYIFHPAAAGVLFLMITFPAFLNTTWLDPITDTVSPATPLGALARGNLTDSLSQLLIGTVPGTVGSTFRIGILLIGVIFSVLKDIDYRIPIYYLGSFIIFTLLFNVIVPDASRDLLMSLFTGSILFAAVFLATDPSTTPNNPKSLIYYGLGLGLITVIIRHFAAFPEGIIFAIIIMNSVAPLIDSFFETEESV